MEVNKKRLDFMQWAREEPKKEKLSRAQRRKLKKKNKCTK